jgi:Sec-independent protein translocase protein TatA
MFSIADMAVAGAVALLLFGPDQLPKVARRAGQLVREMERAADAHDDTDSGPADPAPHSLSAAPIYHETPEPAPAPLVHDVHSAPGQPPP